MKRNSFTTMALVSLLTVAAVCSCDKDEDNKSVSGAIQDNVIEINLENGGSYSGKVDTVKLTIYFAELNRDVAFVSIPYGNGSFTMNLPTSVNAQYLHDNEYSDEELEKLTIINPTAKTGRMFLTVYKSGDEVGALYYGAEDWLNAKDWSKGIYLMYVDGDASIAGSYTGGDPEKGTTVVEYSYDVHLKKGWNMVYEEKKIKDEAKKLYETKVSTQIPAEAKWYLDMYDDK
ncbi:MAG: hypothetical protein LBJ57_06505 [Prevotellaceae bacterium]|jgi:hypothetical protein|nr:hypothetical protein [Prevotellaceae bacterium]